MRNIMSQHYSQQYQSQIYQPVAYGVHTGPNAYCDPPQIRRNDGYGAGYHAQPRSSHISHPSSPDQTLYAQTNYQSMHQHHNGVPPISNNWSPSTNHSNQPPAPIITNGVYPSHQQYYPTTYESPSPVSVESTGSPPPLPPQQQVMFQEENYPQDAKQRPRSYPNHLPGTPQPKSRRRTPYFLGDDPYKVLCCEECPARFARKHDLTRHRRIHTMESPYMCQGCDRSYRRSDARKRHWEQAPACLAMHQERTKAQSQANGAE